MMRLSYWIVAAILICIFAFYSPFGKLKHAPPKACPTAAWLWLHQGRETKDRCLIWMAGRLAQLPVMKAWAARVVFGCQR